MNIVQTLDTNTPPDGPPVDPPVPDDLVIADWIDPRDPDFAPARTVGDVRCAIGEWLASLPDCDWFCPLVFAAKDGRLFMADVKAVVRPAMPDEVRNAVEHAKEWESDMAKFMLEDRIKTLDGYLSKPAFMDPPAPAEKGGAP